MRAAWAVLACYLISIKTFFLYNLPKMSEFLAENFFYYLRAAFKLLFFVRHAQKAALVWAWSKIYAPL